ncbi:hypothetical protein D3C74_482220 [compost metagenome]
MAIVSSTANSRKQRVILLELMVSCLFCIVDCAFLNQRVIARALAVTARSKTATQAKATVRLENWAIKPINAGPARIPA